MNKKIVAVGLLGIGLLGALYFFGKKKTSIETAPPASFEITSGSTVPIQPAFPTQPTVLVNPYNFDLRPPEGFFGSGGTDALSTELNQSDRSLIEEYLALQQRGVKDEPKGQKYSAPINTPAHAGERAFEVRDNAQFAHAIGSTTQGTLYQDVTGRQFTVAGSGASALARALNLPSDPITLARIASQKKQQPTLAPSKAEQVLATTTKQYTQPIKNAFQNLWKR